MKVTGLVLAVVLLIACVGFVAWTRIARYPAIEAAGSLADSHESSEGWLTFEPTRPARVGFIFYPGGLVDPAAYAPLMSDLAERGVLSIIVPMPLDLAVLGINRAGAVLDAYPQIDTWVLGGHSLGGAMAAEYVKRHPDAFDGLVFLASYPAESTDLSDLELQVLSLYGTEDSVSAEVFETSLERLPPETVLEDIPGGNHAQFGAYGPQEGDGEAKIPPEQQREQTVDAIMELVDRLK